MLGQRASGLLEFFTELKVPLLGVLVFLLVGAVFLPSLRNDFVNYDDPDYVTENAHVKQGMTWEGIRWAATTSYASNWHPVTWLSHMMDYQIFGLKSWGHHLTNVLLHAANSVLLFLILRRMTGALWRSLFVALLFGLHPLRVQSVAWVAERKDVLSGLFWMLTIWTYVRYAEGRRQEAEGGTQEEAGEGARGRFRRRHWAFYATALAFFALGLMSKPMVVTLPFVLLLLDYWPLRRLGDKRLEAGDNGVLSRFWRLVGEKLPFLALAAVAGAITFLVQRNTGAMQTFGKFSLISRIDNALLAYCRYLGKLLYPAKLAAFYPHPGTWPVSHVLLAGCVVLGVSILVILQRRNYPYLLVGWFWYVGTLVPVIGLVQVGSQAIADRYTYIPLIGIALLMAWSANDLAGSWRHRSSTLAGVASAVLLGCTLVTHREIGYWVNSETLFRRSLAVTQSNALAHFNLGMAISQKRPEEALKEFETALNLAPDAAELHFKIAGALLDMGNIQAAVEQIEASLALQPHDAEAQFRLAQALQRAGRLDESMAHYREALKLDPELVDAHNNLGLILNKRRQFDEAAVEFRQALIRTPDSAETHARLGVALGEAGRLDDAVAQFQAALRLKPEVPETHNHLGIVLRRQHRFDDAISQFQQALKLRPNYADAHVNLGVAFYNSGDSDEAIKELQEALKLEPGHALARRNLESLIARREAAGKP